LGRLAWVGSWAASPPILRLVPRAASLDGSTSQLVQSIAGFGGGGADISMASAHWKTLGGSYCSQVNWLEQASEEQIQAAILLNDKFIEQLQRIAAGKGN